MNTTLEKAKYVAKEKICVALAECDWNSGRPLRAIVAAPLGTDTTQDITKLARIEERAKTLRKALASVLAAQTIEAVNAVTY